MGRHELDCSGPGYGKVACCCECDNEPSCSIQCGEFLSHLRICQLLRKDCYMELVNYRLPPLRERRCEVEVLDDEISITCGLT